MDEKLTAIWEKIKSFFGAMSKTTKILLVVLVAVIGIIFFARWVVESTKPYEVVFYDLTNADMTTASTFLVENGVPEYKIDGNDLLVPDGMADQMRAAMYMQGIPNSGSAYQTYKDMVGTMSTDSDKEIAYVANLENSLAGTIRKFEGVHDATVYIAEGEDRRYVLDSSNMSPTKASVSVVLSGSQILSKEVASAIRMAVCSAVTDLDIQYVSVYDNMGNTYSDTDSGMSAISEASQVKMQLEEDVNNRVRSEINWLLSSLYLPENIRISVNSTVDIDRKVSSSTEYPTPEYGLTDEEDPRGIIGSEVGSGYVYGPDGTAVGGIVGANPNSDIPMYPADADGDGVLDYYGGSNWNIEYAVPEIVTQKEQLAGIVTDIQIGITINSDAGSDLSVAEIKELVARTALIPTEIVDEKIAVAMAPFKIVEVEDDNTTMGIANWVWFAVLAGLALFVIIIIIVVILVRKKKREEEEALLAAEEEERRLEAEREAAEIAAIAPVDGADIMDVNTEKSMELRKDLRTFVGNNPEIAASLLRNLMKGGEPPDAS